MSSRRSDGTTTSCLDWVMERHLHGGQAQGNKGEHHAILGHAGASSCLARTVLAVPGGVLPLCRRRRAQQSSGWSRGHTYQRSRVSGWPAGTWEVGSRLRAPVLACTKSELQSSAMTEPLRKSASRKSSLSQGSSHRLPRQQRSTSLRDAATTRMLLAASSSNRRRLSLQGVSGERDDEPEKTGVGQTPLPRLGHGAAFARRPGSRQQRRTPRDSRSCRREQLHGQNRPCSAWWCSTVVPSQTSAAVFGMESWQHLTALSALWMASWHVGSGITATSTCAGLHEE
ncbi:uncharacterized protein LOC144115083 isoform X2 [Amblyomma americanum]